MRQPEGHSEALGASTVRRIAHRLSPWELHLVLGSAGLSSTLGTHGSRGSVRPASSRRARAM